MNRVRWFLLATALTVLVCGQAAVAEQAKEGKAKSAAAKDGLRGEYAMMASECKLSEDQIAQVKAKVKAREDAVAEWTKTNGDKLKGLQETAKKAKEGADKAAQKKANDDLRAVEAERNKIQTEGTASILAVLTPEQKLVWAGFVLDRTLLNRLRKANLTDEQKGKIRPLANEAAKEMAAIKGDDKEAKKMRAEIEAKVTKTIDYTILTAEQKAEIAKKPEPKAAEKKPAEKPPAK